MAVQTILIVDDARAIREFVADVILQPSGYRVLQAESGTEALETAAREHPDLIISDIKMPGLSGLDVARAVRQEWPDLPVILITAEGSEELAQQALRAGVSDYFIKPFDPEELLRAAQQALARAEAAQAARHYAAAEAERARLFTILNEIEEGVLVLDDAGRLVLVNHAARRLFAVERLDVTGRPPAELFTHADLLAVLAGERRAEELILEDGRTLSAQLTPIANVGRVLVLHDITHLKELDRIKSDFVTTVSHDLRTPLTSILGYVSLLERVGPLNARQLEFVEQVRTSVQAMTALLTELLDLGRIEAGLETHKEVLHLSGLANRVVEERLPLARSRHQILHVRVSPNLPLVLVNPARLRQMLANLLDNALKYTPERGQVSLDVYAEGEFVVLAVTDSGIGIPPADQPFVFDKFFRASNTRGQYPGTGLGLSIVKSIVDQHGGRIWVDAHPGHGTTFTVMLPVAPAESQSAPVKD